MRSRGLFESVEELLGLTEPQARARARAAELGLAFRDMTPPHGMGQQAPTNRCVTVTCNKAGVVTNAIIY